MVRLHANTLRQIPILMRTHTIDNFTVKCCSHSDSTSSYSGTGQSRGYYVTSPNVHHWLFRMWWHGLNITLSLGFFGICFVLAAVCVVSVCTFIISSFGDFFFCMNIERMYITQGHIISMCQHYKSCFYKSKKCCFQLY